MLFENLPALTKNKRYTHLTITFGLLMLLIAALFAPSAYSGEKWVRTKAKPFAKLGEMANIDVIPLGGSQFRAYYMKDGQIYSALSGNDGKTYSEEGALFSGDHFAAIKLQSGQVRIYYTSFEDGGLYSKISEDGLDFTDEGERLSGDEASIIHPSVIALPGGGYRMYYDKELSFKNGVNFGKKIRSAYSEDGLVWTVDEGNRIKLRQKGIPVTADMVFSPFAQYNEESGKYKLYMTVEDNRRKKKSGVYLATSGDGLKFKIKKESVLGLDPRVSHPTATNSGLKGSPQDTFIITTSRGSQLMYIWQSERGYIKAKEK